MLTKKGPTQGGHSQKVDKGGPNTMLPQYWNG